MPRLDNPKDVVRRITGIQKGRFPMTSDAPAYLVIRGFASAGEREILMTEDAARDLWAKLKVSFGHEVDDDLSDFLTS